MEAALADRVRIQQSRIRNLISLESLCLRTVSNNLYFYVGKPHLFAALPWSILESLIQKCPELRSPAWLEHVAKEQTQNLSVQLGPEHIVNSVCRHIHTNCKNLRGLSLSWCVRDEVEATVSGSLCRLLCALPHLRVLKLHRLPVTDKVLEVVASTCIHLRSLEILGASRVSTAQMCHLIENCSQLEELNFGGVRDPNSVLRHALLSLDKLRILSCTGLESVLAELSLEKEVILKLQQIHLSAYNFTQVTSEFSLNCLANMLPLVQELSLEGFGDVTPFMEFKSVSKLLLKGMSCELLIQNYATKLTYLNIYICDSEIDLSMIGYYCTNLESLFIQSTEINSQGSYGLNDEHFTKIKVVFLQPYVENSSRLIPIASSVMYKLLSAPNLNHFSSYFILLSHTLLCNLIADAEQGGKVFSQLEYLDVDVVELPADLAIQLVCAAPKLKELSLQRMLEDDLDQLLSFVRENLPTLSCSMV